MTAAQLIEKLQEMIDRHGNRYVENDKGGVFSNIEFNDDVEGEDAVFILT